MKHNYLPRILIIDDLNGRNIKGSVNTDRETFCSNLGILDVTPGQVHSSQQIISPTAEAVFIRGQSPVSAEIGDNVENDLDSIIDTVRAGWIGGASDKIWSIVLIDLCFYTGKVTATSNAEHPGMPEGCDSDSDPSSFFGFSIIKKLNTIFPELPLVVLSSMPKDQSVKLQYSRNGALGFLPKGMLDGDEQLKQYIQDIGLYPDDSETVIGQSIGLLKVLQQARRCAVTDDPVFLSGETGVGKTMFARYMHNYSKDSKMPFLHVNIGSLEKGLVETRLFGIRKKTATGVDEQKGLFKTCEGGSLFLDEIGDLDAGIQVSLNQVVDNKEFQVVGDEKLTKADVKLYSASNKDLLNTGFREDLFHRLRKGGEIHIPPLRERKEDISILAEHFKRKFIKKDSKYIDREISPEAIEKIENYNWPGNIRELEDTIERAIVNFPYVEVMTANHIEFLKSEISDLPPSRPDKSHESVAENISQTHSSGDIQESVDIEMVLNLLRGFDAKSLSQKELRGIFPDIEKSYAIFLIGLLLEIIESNRSFPEDLSQTVIKYNAVVKHFLGDDDIKATPARRFINMILKISPEITISKAESNPILKKLIKDVGDEKLDNMLKNIKQGKKND